MKYMLNYKQWYHDRPWSREVEAAGTFLKVLGMFL